MWERIREIMRKEFRQVIRNPRMRTMLFVPPLLQLIVFGYAVNLDVENSRLAWMDEDRTPQSRDLLAAFQASGRFQLSALPKNEFEVQDLLDRGKTDTVVRVLPGFARDLSRGRPTQVQVLVDGTNSNTASLLSSYAAEIIARFSIEASRSRQSSQVLVGINHGMLSLKTPQLAVRSRVWFNPDLKSRNYFVPGVIVNIIMVVTVMLTAMAIVREKEIGTMEQLMVTPIRPIELMIGKTLPFAAVGLMDVVMITTAALLVFRIPFRGSALFLLLCAILFLMTSLGAGLFVSTISKTQQQALMSSFFFSLPVFMLSGFIFPVNNMPPIVQWLTLLNPLRYFMEIVRGLFLKGTGIRVLWPQMLALAFYGVAVLLLSASRFRKRLD